MIEEKEQVAIIECLCRICNSEDGQVEGTASPELPATRPSTQSLFDKFMARVAIGTGWFKCNRFHHLLPAIPVDGLNIHIDSDAPSSGKCAFVHCNMPGHIMNHADRIKLCVTDIDSEKKKNNTKPLCLCLHHGAIFAWYYGAKKVSAASRAPCLEDLLLPAWIQVCSQLLQLGYDTQGFLSNPDAGHMSDLNGRRTYINKIKNSVDLYLRDPASIANCHCDSHKNKRKENVTTTNGRRICSGCSIFFFEKEFTMTQWKKAAGQRRCRHCQGLEQ